MQSDNRSKKTDLSIVDIPENEVFPVEEFGEFKIRLCSNDGNGDVIDFMEWIRNHNM